MGHLIFYIIVVVLYIVLRCGRSDTSTQIFFGSKWSDWEKKKKEPDAPEKRGWLARKLHESTLKGEAKLRQKEERGRQLDEHIAQMQEIIRLQKEEKRKKKEEALRQREEEKLKEKERKRLLKEERKRAKAEQK